MNRRALPNLITALRIGFIPLFLALFYVDPAAAGHPWAALLFALLAASDWLDGYLARRWQASSALGALLDPIADKLLTTAALVLLVADRPGPWLTLCAFVLLGRDLAISALRAWANGQGLGHVLAVTPAAKLKTACEMAALLLMLAVAAPSSWQKLGMTLLAVAACLSLATATTYLRRAVSGIREQATAP